MNLPWRNVQCASGIGGWYLVSGGAAPILHMETERERDMIVVRCAGRVVIESWALFSTTVREVVNEGKPVRVDLSEVIHVDSTGIGAFVSVWASAKKNGCDLKFINPNKRMQDVVIITKLHDMFDGPALDFGADS